MNVARWLSQHVDICPGLWLVADLFTQLCSLSPDPRPDSSSCAEAAGVGGQGCSQMHFGGWRGGVRDFITPSSKTSSPDWSPSGKEERCCRGLALQLLAVCLYEIGWVSICLRPAGLCFRNLFRWPTCSGGVGAVHSRRSVRSESSRHHLDFSDASHLSYNAP